MFKIEKRKNYSINILILIISSLLLSPILLNSSILNNFVYQASSNSGYSLRTSDPELDIITPLNSTYSAPMSGYYPATYGFEDDQIGVNEPHFWNNDDGNGVESTVISEKFGHYNVLQQETGIISGTQSLTLTGSYSSTWAALATRPITPSSDIISLEAHLIAEQFTGNNGPDPGIIKICFYNPSGNQYFTTLYLHNSGAIIFTNSTTGGVFNFGTFTPYTWYHMKIVVNITENSAKAYVNGQLMAETHLGLDASDITHIALLSGHNSVTGYVDNVIYTEGESEQVIFKDDFESYAIGTFPSSFNLIYNGIGTSYQVVTDSYSYSDDQASLWCDVDSQPYGSVEFYMGHDGFQSEIANLNIMFSSGVNNIFGLQMRYDGKWTYWDGNWETLGFGSHVDGEFYHVSIRFRCSSGTPYEGLSSLYTWKTFINGIEFGEFSMIGVMDVDRLTVFTSGSSSNGFGYWDAFGCTWDPNYNIGDNLNEGLLLSFENSTIMDWMGYSLDGAANITIQGNTTIPLSEDGHHTIQVSGTSPGGIDYQSDLRYFTVKCGAISIITPENKTYTAPMRGYYPATYGFENDADGIDPVSWIDQGWGGHIAQVISGIDGHNKVVEMYDFSSSGKPRLNNTLLSAQDYGSIDFWIRTSDATDGTEFMLFSNSECATDIRIRSDRWQYADFNWDGFDIPGISNIPLDNTWYRVTYHFECTLGGYLGLGQYQAKVVINGEESNAFNFRYNGASITNVILSGVNLDQDYYLYYDAIGYSWDPNYQIGDNINEGLLLSFENSTVMDWMGYSLDGAASITIQGNTTIPLSEDGHHTIQVSGTSPGGIDYQSDLRHFTVNRAMISIITPENTTYTVPMSGYYPATYGFDDIGRSGTNIDFVDGTSLTCNLTLVNNIGSHNGVLQYNGTPNGNFYHEFGSNYINGKVEFWIRVEDINNAITDLQLWEVGGSTLIQKFRIHSGEFQRQTGEFIFATVQAVSADTWYHIRIDWYPDDTYDLYIDDILKVTGVSLYNSMTIGCNRIRIYTFYDGNIFIDGWGNSWNSDYKMGDNLNEGLLLSYENSTALNWLGYSLDGAANITIQGNTTIPMPTGNGLHSIQVSGTTLGGTKIQSELRYFSLDWEYISLRPNLNILDLINEFGVHIEVYMNSIGFLHVDRQTFTFPGLPHIEYNQSTSYFYKLDLYNPKFLEDTSILSSMTIRFYFDPLEINDPSKLQLYHYISSTGHWRSEDIIINIDQHYVEITTTQLSYFCLSEIDIPITPFPWFIIIIIIIILSAISLSIPSGYVIITRRKKKQDKNYKSLNKKNLPRIKKPVSPVEQYYQSNMIKPRISPEMIVPIKSLKAKSKPKTDKLKRTVKDDKEEPQVLDIKLSQNIIDEIKKTESEIEINKEIDQCIIHKGPIIGLSYVCPKCFSKYCINCAQALEERQERCWVCENPINIKQEPPNYSKQLKKTIEENLIGTYKISSENIIERLQGGGNLTTISDKFWENINNFDWEGNDKEEFIKEMLSLTPKERQEIINLMLKTKNKRPLPK